MGAVARKEAVVVKVVEGLSCVGGVEEASGKFWRCSQKKVARRSLPRWLRVREEAGVEYHSGGP